MTTLPRGPRSMLRQAMAAYLGDPDKMQLAALREYGDTFTMPSLFGPYFVTANPEGIRTILTADPDTFDPALNDVFDVFPGNGDGSLFKMSGDKHRAARKLLAPPFHGARMRAYGAMMRDTALEWTRRWAPGEPFLMMDTAQAITLDIIIRAIFGVSGADRIQRFHKQVVDFLAAFVPSIVLFKALRRSFFGLGPWARFQRQLGRLEALTHEEVAAHRAAPEGREDILTLLLASRYEDGRPLSEVELFSQLLTFVFAGHETTAISLTWAVYFLHRNPETLARLREELQPHSESLEPDAIAKLPYLEAVCQETLRLRPVVPLVSRKLARPLVVMGYALPAGMALGAGAFLAHMREDVFPEPAAFRPARFLSRTYSPFEYLPFGGGARRCLGAAFAMYEMKIVLASILAKKELVLLEKRPVTPRVRAATVGPRTGIRMMCA